MPASGSISRRRSPPNHSIRARSQPSIENRHGTLPAISPLTTNPMKNFFENLLYLTPHHYISTTTSFANRTKISSSSSVTAHSDRSSHMKGGGHPSIVSSFSVRSTNVTSFYEIRVYIS